MSWQQLHLQCEQSYVDLAEALLLEEGAVSILLEDAGDEPLFEPLPGEEPLWSQVVLTAVFDTHTTNAFSQVNFESIISDIASQVNASRFWLSQLDDKDWSREWMQHYQPIALNNNLWIIPEWLQAPNPNAINILIDPGLAFGTGYHATTRLCLDWLSEQDLSDKIVLDYGCGSGILGVAALLLGAKSVLAVDIDPQAIIATQQNAKRNGVADRLHTFLPEEFANYRQNNALQIDLITANILAKPLIGFAPFFAEILPKDGKIVLAGLITSQTEEVMSAYTPYFLMDKPFCYDTTDDAHWHRLSGIRQAH
ncbi:MAG: 50S ribosomal protein L11 methyltransferase [Moraxella sp.]|nr:50S ribosomal protein L11 methyltransferase [Moraxella sp.]